MTGRGHLGDLAAGLVDGSLDHTTRERALVHLTHCEECRAQVEAERRLKARLRDASASGPPVPPDLAARLASLAAAAPMSAPPPGSRPPGAPRATVRPARRPAGLRSATRRRAAGGLLLAAVLAGAFVLGAPPSGPDAPVHPASPTLVTEYVSTTSEVPLTEPVFASLVQPVGAARGPGR